MGRLGDTYIDSLVMGIISGSWDRLLQDWDDTLCSTFTGLRNRQPERHNCGTFVPKFFSLAHRQV